jgi:hypothetical protein
MNATPIDWFPLRIYLDEETNEVVVVTEWWPHTDEKFRLRVAVPSGCCPEPGWSVDEEAKVLEIHVFKKETEPTPAIAVKSNPNFEVQRNIPRERGSKNGLEIGPTARKTTTKKAPLKSCLRVRLETPVPIPSNCLPCYRHPFRPNDDINAFRRSKIAEGEYTNAKCNLNWGVSTAARKELGLVSELCQKINGVSKGLRSKKSVSWGDSFSLESCVKRIISPMALMMDFFFMRCLSSPHNEIWLQPS